jgi:hypothetical protein
VRACGSRASDSGVAHSRRHPKRRFSASTPGPSRKSIQRSGRSSPTARCRANGGPPRNRMSPAFAKDLEQPRLREDPSAFDSREFNVSGSRQITRLSSRIASIGLQASPSGSRA